MNYTDYIARSRRLFILRLLAEPSTLGTANQDVIFLAARAHGFAAAIEADVERDIDHLHRHGCVGEEWLGGVRIVTLTARGENCASGRVVVEGVEHSLRRG